MTTPASILERFVRQQTVLLTTYRRDGTSVGTPVHMAVEGDRAFVRTWDTAGKFKRIRNSSEVEITPSTFRGRPTGPTIHARAKILSGSESTYAGQTLAQISAFAWHHHSAGPPPARLQDQAYRAHAG